MDDGEALAIMKGVGIGMRDAPYPCLWFTAYTGEASASLQILTWKEAEKLVKESKIYDVKSLEGKPCIVDISKPGLVQFVRIADI